MSVRPRPWPQVPEATALVAKAAFAKGSLAIRVRDELGEVFADEEFVAAFGVRGRPGASPGQLALVTVLQFAENLTDRQAADAVRGRIDWKYALGLELGDPGFDFTVLSGFRARLVEHGLEETVLDLLLARCVELGLVKAGGRQRTDSTHVVAAVRGLNRLELVGETMRSALEALAVAAPDWLAAHVQPEWLQRYGARVEAYRLPKSDDERGELQLAIGHDGYRLLAVVVAGDAPAWLAEIPAVQTLRLVWVQQYDRTCSPAGGQEVHWREDDDLPPGGLRVTSPYDTDARYGVKRGEGWNGYKVHLTETCDDVDASGRPHLVTGVATTEATVPDVAMTQPVHADLARKGLLPSEHLVDAGSTSADLLVTTQRDYGVTLTGPVPADTARQTAAKAGFQAAAFTIDFDAQQVICPAGATSTTWTPTRDPRSGKDVIRARFSPVTCRPCPLREQCTRDKTGVRQLMFHPREPHQALQAARAEQATDAWWQRYAVRSGVEGTMHQAVAATGIRRTRYTGKPKTRLAHVFAATAINLIRLDAWWTGTPLARTRTSHLTRLGLALAA